MHGNVCIGVARDKAKIPSIPRKTPEMRVSYRMDFKRSHRIQGAMSTSRVPVMRTTHITKVAGTRREQRVRKDGRKAHL